MKEEGASVVIGVMLMLVVTIVLASVIALFASGMVSSSSTNPVHVEIVFAEPNQTGDGFIFEMRSGEPFLLSNMKLVYSLRENPTVYDPVFFDGGTVTIDRCRFTARTPEFTVPKGSHITYSFYDINAGVLVSAGEILNP